METRNDTSIPARELWVRVTREIREQGLTLTQLAGELRMSRQTLDRWRTRTQAPRPATVIKVADRLGIPRAEALRLAGLDPEQEHAEESPTSAVETRLERLLAELPPRRRAALMRMRDEERQRYEESRQQAQEAYLSGMARLAELAKLDLEDDHSHD